MRKKPRLHQTQACTERPHIGSKTGSIRLFPPKHELDADGRHRFEVFVALLATGLRRAENNEHAARDREQAVPASRLVGEP